MPDLAALPAATQVFVDTNIFYLHFSGKSATCTAFLTRIANGELVAYVNTEVLSDLIHKLMLAEACAKGFITSPNASKMKARLLADRTLIAGMPDHQKQFESILAIGVKVLPVSARLLVETKVERAAQGLMTNDSLHLGNMNRYANVLRDIVTRDGDFEHVPNLLVWEPQDVIP